MADAARPKKRQVSEQRRQQNRRAQKNYRERQKQHVRTLEGLLESQTPFLGAPDVNGPDREPEPNPITARGLAPATALYLLGQNASLLTAGSMEAVPISAGQPGSVITREHLSESPGNQNQWSGSSTSLNLSASALGSASYHPPDHSLSRVLSAHPGQSDIVQFLNHLLQDNGNLDENIQYEIVSGGITIQDILKAGLNALSRPAASERPQDPSPTYSSEKERSVPEPVLRTDKILVLETKMQAHAHSLPDVYTNHLRIKELSTIAAVRANAEMLGITFLQLIDPETESPFYSVCVSKNAVEAVSLTEFQNVSPHLQPTASQIRHSHHPYIDALPFPTFRQRVTELISMEPPMIDEDDLCQDFEKGGLNCWGSCLGSKDATGSGAPWDWRSWEAQPWFLKKWWLVVGGVDGELFQQSKWWNEMRGDRMAPLW